MLGTGKQIDARVDRASAGRVVMKKYRIAVLDDYQDVALEIADWSALHDQAHMGASS
jgi:hypothetical protein